MTLKIYAIMDGMLHSAASHLGLYCLPKSFFIYNENSLQMFSNIVLSSASLQL